MVLTQHVVTETDFLGQDKYFNWRENKYNFHFFLELQFFEIHWVKTTISLLFFSCFFTKGTVSKTHSKSEKSNQLSCSLMYPVFLDCSSYDSQIWHEKGVENGNRTYPALPSNIRSFTCAQREDLGNLAEEGNTSGVFWLSCKMWKRYNPVTKLVHFNNLLY